MSFRRGGGIIPILQGGHFLGNKIAMDINQKYRMIYSVNNEIVTVEVVSAMGHYFDK